MIIRKGEARDYMVVVTAIGLGTLSAEGLKVGMSHCFYVVWFDGGHLHRNAPLRQETNLDVFFIQKVDKTLDTTGAC